SRACPSHGAVTVVIRHSAARKAGARSPFCVLGWLGSVMPNLIQRRSGNEGIERSPELRAKIVTLHEYLVLGAGHHQMRTGAQQRAEVLDRRVRHDGVSTGRDDQDRLGD